MSLTVAMKSMLATVLCLCATFCHAQADDMPFVQVAKDKKAFVLDPSGISISAGAGSQGNPAVGFDGTNFFVAWEDSRRGPLDLFPELPVSETQPRNPQTARPRRQLPPRRFSWSPMP